MWQFMYGSDEMFEDIENRARRACVRIQGQEMPPGSMPKTATIGFEVDPHSGLVRLLVERGSTYNGSSADVRSWLATGIKTFENFVQMRSWLGSTLREAFRIATATTDQHPDGTDACSLNEPNHDLDEVGAKGFRIAMRLGCRTKDLPS